MNIKEGIEKRFSVRAFTDQVPSIELIKEILKTAGSAPSGGNIQPWKVYVLNENVKKSLLLTVPHPRMHLRKFVLLPLFEIVSNWSHPLLKKNIKYFLEKVKYQRIKKLKIY